jgi:hypothetical protein
LNLKPPDGDWSDYNVDDSSLRTWIPEPLDDCLDSLSLRFLQTKSDLARNALMIHVHGRYAFEQLVEHKLWRVSRRQQVEDAEPIRKLNTQIRPGQQTAPRTAFIRVFGKNSRDLKVWMPKRLKLNLESVANVYGQPLSEYARRALTAYYLGRTALDPMAFDVEEP